jgi:chemotaxis methyl-accepting protein methylase
METQLLHRFTQLIALHTGLQMRAEEADKLRHTIRARMAAQQLINPEAYYQLLSIDTAARGSHRRGAVDNSSAGSARDL